MNHHHTLLSIVVIGRNEGSNLIGCLLSCQRALRAFARPAELIYVDSCSTDGSLELALSLGARVASLPPRECGAARARNEGLRLANGRWVHFVDGDMELMTDWISYAYETAERQRLDAIAGRIEERRKGASVWSRAFGHDWNAAGAKVGPIGGAGLWRRSSLLAVGGFDVSLPVGEDPDLCHRMQARGYRLVALEFPMVRHSMGLTSPWSWWRRGVSVGTSAAHMVQKDGRNDLAWQRFGQPALFLAALGIALTTGPFAVLALLLCAFAVVARRALRDLRDGLPFFDALLHALHVYLIKIPQLLGGLVFLRNEMRKATA